MALSATVDKDDYGAGDGEDCPLNLFTDYIEKTVEYDGAQGEMVKQTVLGWSQGACDIVWSEVLPRVVVRNLDQLQGRHVLELGAGCGLIGILAARSAASVLITDGDREEVTLIKENCAQHAAAAGVASGYHLEWGAAAAKEATEKSASPLRGKHAYDMILGSQITYVPKYIKPLVETIDFFLAPQGEMLLFNDAVSLKSTYEEVRAEVDKSLAAYGFVWEEVIQPEALWIVPDDTKKLMRRGSYFIKITRDANTKSNMNGL